MVQKFPKLTFVYNRYNRLTSQGAVLEIRITYDRKQKYISTGIMLLPNQWEDNTIINRPDAITLNKHLDSIVSEIKQIIYSMIQENNVDIFSIPKRMRQNSEKKITFIEFCKKRMKVRTYGKSKDNKDRYNRFLRLFQEYGVIKYFEDITDNNIIDYDKYLADRKLKPYSKWNNYHRFLNSFILDAIDEGLVHRNPYKWLNIDKDKNYKTIHKCLTPEEFHRIKITKMPTESIERVRDLFVFQTYMCLAYSDLKNFNTNYISEVNGMKVYIGNRIKTDKGFTIPMLKPAIEILKKYNGKLPIISNVKYNEYLKIVAQAAGIDKPISTHWARHTGATMLLNEGIDMKIVAKICGHSSTKITEQVYAKLLDETVVNAVKGISKKRKGYYSLFSYSTYICI